ncbi:Saposin B-type domain-containing protein [Trichostrongylus colubriformis]|uniref:Saposin B-type domain-containing protein n=1 Tax=Trichostrongylus colubriformis TaxID=6319 RepID=A0AAN8F5P4_TRICO
MKVCCFAPIFTAILAVAYGQRGGLMCGFCITIVTTTQESFGASIANTTDVQFLRYFRRECRLDALKSAMMAGVCEYMVSNHPLVLFRDLRSGSAPADTCADCGVCPTGTSPSAFH